MQEGVSVIHTDLRYLQSLSTGVKGMMGPNVRQWVNIVLVKMEI